jgi:hypothetical protein
MKGEGRQGRGDLEVGVGRRIEGGVGRLALAHRGKRGSLGKEGIARQGWRGEGGGGGPDRVCQGSRAGRQRRGGRWVRGGGRPGRA